MSEPRQPLPIERPWKILGRSSGPGGVQSITYGIEEPPQPPPPPPAKRSPRSFDLAALLSEPLAHPCLRFPAWAVKSDGAAWPLLDRHIGDILALSNAPTLDRLAVFNQSHQNVAKILVGTNDLRFGFSGMPSEVSRALRGGEMRLLAQLAGWRGIRIRYPENTIASATGCDGVTLYFDENGRPSYDKGGDLL